jgi:hypothetical protein
MHFEVSFVGKFLVNGGMNGRTVAGNVEMYNGF